MKKWKDYLHIIVVLMTTAVICIAMSLSPKEDSIYIDKNGYGESEEQIPFLLEKQGEERQIDLTVRERKLSEEELKLRVEEAFDFLIEHMKGENASLEEVRTGLDYTLDYEKYPFELECVCDDPALVSREGTVSNTKKELIDIGYTKEKIEKGIPTTVRITLWYGEEKFERNVKIVVYEQVKSVQDELFLKVEEHLQKLEEEALFADGFFVPAMVNDVHIKRIDERPITPLHVLLLGIILTILLIFRDRETEKKKKEMRKERLIRSYPWFVNELVLLLGAGMQPRKIFQTIVKEYEAQNPEGDYRDELVFELKGAVHAMHMGMSQEQVYYNLGRRIGLTRYIKLMTMLEQSVKHGGKGMLEAFEQEEIQALEERKNLAKRYGEEASTKLLGPMVILLLVVMMMIMIPALWSFA